MSPATAGFPAYLAVFFKIMGKANFLSVFDIIGDAVFGKSASRPKFADLLSIFTPTQAVVRSPMPAAPPDAAPQTQSPPTQAANAVIDTLQNLIQQVQIPFNL